MSICADKDWTMDLVADDPNKPDKENFTFKNIRVVNGILTGRAYDAKGNYSDLRGSCVTFGPVAQMTFVFTALNDKSEYVDIVLLGGGFPVPDEQPRFTGRFEVFKRASAAKAVAGTGFDEGDTGTGTGMQAMMTRRNRT